VSIPFDHLLTDPLLSLHTYPAYPPDYPLQWKWAAGPWGMMAVAFAVVSLMMTGVTLLANRWKNAGLVDVAWALGFVLVASIYGTLGHGWQPRQALVTATLFTANLRLFWHLQKRFRRNFAEEDTRYKALRTQWQQHYSPAKVDQFFTMVFYGQGLLLVLLTMPVAFGCPDPTVGFSLGEYTGAGLWLVGMIFAAVADKQLSEFKERVTDRTAVCKEGLWALSRHPNYFGEWLTWLAYGLMGTGSPMGLWALWVPAVMFILLRYLSGVGATEAQALLRKGEAYRQYQQSTPVFFPKLMA
jgi:steroid 5-alpha reductase family enzyme